MTYVIACTFISHCSVTRNITLSHRQKLYQVCLQFWDFYFLFFYLHSSSILFTKTGLSFNRKEIIKEFICLLRHFTTSLYQIQVIHCTRYPSDTLENFLLLSYSFIVHNFQNLSWESL